MQYKSNNNIALKKSNLTQKVLKYNGFFSFVGLFSW